MNKLTILAFATLGVSAAALAGDPIVITVTPSIAPNAFGSSNWNAYRDNAVDALELNAPVFGTIGTPSFYQTYLNNETALSNVATGFTSWRGNANPSAPYNGELGNRVHFGLHAIGVNQTFSLSQVTFDMNSNDGGNFFDFDGGFTAADAYSASRVGIFYGANGIKGGGDDVVFQNGESATNLINELMYVGVGNAVEALVTDPGATNQDKIFGVLNDTGLSAGYSITTTYSIGQFSGTGTAVFQPVPEPGTLAALGLGAIALIRRRRKK